MRHLSIILFALWIMLVGVMPGHADKRVALVIGNASYQSMPLLPNPKNDATDLGAQLRELGFETIVATDLDRSGINAALDRFSRIVPGADIALVYYAGHGMQFAGTNFLLPVDARLDSVEDVNRFRLTPVDDILDTLKLASGARILVLDACRNNPVEEDLKRRLAVSSGGNRDAILTRGFARPSAGNGLLVAYATQANDVANDGIGRNSPFTASLLRHIGTPDIDVRAMLFRVQDDVDRITNHRQRPELAISLIGEFKLKVTPPPPPKVEEVKPAQPSGVPTADVAAQDWKSVETATSVAALEAFKRRHPGTFQAELADLRIEELKRSNTPATAPVAAVNPKDAKPEPPAGTSLADLVAAQDWKSVETSTSIAALQVFKRRHPGTFQAELADLRIEELKKTQIAAVPASPPSARPAPPAAVAPADPPPVAPKAPPPTPAPPAAAAPVPATPAPSTAAAPAAPAASAGSPLATPAAPTAPTPPVAQEGAPSSKPVTPPVQAAPPSAPMTQAAVVPPVALPVPVDPCSGTMTVSFATRCAKPLTLAQERALSPKDSFRECEDCPEMVVLPAGSFTMGSPRSEKDRDLDESPQHAVTIGKPFAVGKFHVTRDQFAAFVAATGSDAGTKCSTTELPLKPRPPRSWQEPGFAQEGSHPVLCLSWNDAKAYVDWIAQQTGKPYRLLSEAEWEYAARGGSSTRYTFGNDEKDICRHANLADQTTKSAVPSDSGLTFATCRDGFAYTSPVGSFTANGFGLHDMQGNAWQWTEDCYHDSYQGAPADGSAWTSGDCFLRALRGGTWGVNPKALRLANRFWNANTARNREIGFRVARTLSAP